MYNLANTKERLYLLQAALDTNQTELARNLLESFPVEHPSMQEYVALFQFLTNNRKEAFGRFLSLYEQTKKKEHAYGVIAAAWAEKDPSLAGHLEKVFSDQPELLQLTVNVCGDVSPITIDKKKMYEFMIHLSGTLYVTDYRTLFDLAKRSDLLLEMGNYLYYRECYRDAYQFYIDYQEQNTMIPEDILTDITCKKGDCLGQTGHDEQAWTTLHEAHALSPENYTVYELIIDLAKRNNRLNEVSKVIKTGVRHFPDSTFLNQVIQQAKG